MQTDPISAAHGYVLALRRVLKAQTLHEARKAASGALEITFTPPEEAHIGVASGFGHNTKQPFVTFSLANPTESANPTIQMTTQEARQIAIQILEAADAAESDGFLIGWLQEGTDISDAQLGRLIAEFRAYRARLRDNDRKDNS